MKHLIWIMLAFSVLFVGCQRVDYKKANEIVAFADTEESLLIDRHLKMNHLCHKEKDMEKAENLAVYIMIASSEYRWYSSIIDEFPKRYREYLKLRLDFISKYSEFIQSFPKYIKTGNRESIDTLLQKCDEFQKENTIYDYRLKEYKDIKDDILSHKEDKK